MKIRNVSPLGDLDVVLLGREVKAGEAVNVTTRQAAELCKGDPPNFVRVPQNPPKPKKPKAAAAGADTPKEA